MFDELDSTPGSFFSFQEIIKMRILIFIFNFFTRPSEASEAIVQLEKGTLHGVREVIDGVSVDKYFGVPYAKPPINDLRFKRTVEEEPWEGVLEAQQLRPLCAQAMNCSGCEGYEVSEDCLYLNIFGPSDTTERLPGERLSKYW